MTSATKTRNQKKSTKGFTLVELSVVITISGILVISFLSLFDGALTLFKRVRAQDIVSLQIDPLKAIFQTHVRACRYTLHDSKANAIGKTSGLIQSVDSSTSGDFALRCARRDGAGVFIIYWDTTLSGNVVATWYTSGRFPTVQLITGQNPGDDDDAPAEFNNPIPLTSALSFFGIDISGGFMQVNLRIPSTLSDNNGARYSYVRSTSAFGANTEIPYGFFVDSTL